MPDSLTELSTKVHALPAQARNLTINDPESYNVAAQMLGGIKALLKEVDASCGPVISAAFKAHRAATTQKKTLEAPLLEAERWLKHMMGEYLQAERKRRDEEYERRLEEEIAKRQAERADYIAALKAAGDSVLADAVDASPLGTFPTSPDDVPPSADGISVRKIYRAEVVDMAILVRSVHEGRVPLKALLPNMVVLNSLARSLGAEFNVPGDMVREDVSISARALEG